MGRAQYVFGWKLQCACLSVVQLLRLGCRSGQAWASCIRLVLAVH